MAVTYGCKVVKNEFFPKLFLAHLECSTSGFEAILSQFSPILAHPKDSP